MVLYGHALETSIIERSPTPWFAFAQWQFVHAFHMPLFFVISGMLFRQRPFRDALANSLALLLIAYGAHVAGWLIKALVHATGGLVGIDIYATVSSSSLVTPIVENSDFSIVVVWFLVALAFVQMIYHLFSVSSNMWRIAIVAALLVAFTISQLTGRNHFQIASLLPGTIFYALGRLLVRFDLTRLGLPFGMAALACVALLAPLNNGCLLSAGDHCGVERLNGEFGVMMIDGRFGFLPAFIITAVLGSLAVIWCASAIASKFGAYAEPLSRIGVIHLFLLNGFVLQFVQPFIRLLVVSDSDADSYVGIAWAVGLTAAQIAILPLATDALRPFVDAAKRLSRTLAQGPSAMARPLGARAAKVRAHASSSG